MKKTSVTKREIVQAVETLRAQHPSPADIVDWRETEIGRQNWEVCHRMLIHDLVDLNLPEVNTLLAFYRVFILSNGAHTAALPRYAWNKPRTAEKSKPQVSGRDRERKV